MGHRFRLLIFLSVFFSIFPFSPVFSEEVIQFGLCPKFDPETMNRLYQPFMNYLNQNTAYRFKVKLTTFHQETVGRTMMGETPIAFCGPVPYLKAKEKFNVSPILRALNKDGDSYYRGIIVTREDSPVRNLSDLKKKSFAFAQEWSTAGHILPRYHLLKSGVGLKDLKRYAFLRSHDFVINAVLTGEFDAGAVKDIVAHKYKKKGLRYVYITDPIPTWSVIVRTDAQEEMVRSVKASLLKLDPKNPGTRKLMAKWDEEIQYGVIETSPSDYDGIRRILDVIEKETKP